MKSKFVIFETRVPAWVREGRDAYAQKLAAFVKFEIVALKSPGAAREQAEVKRRREADILLREVGAKDLLILFDESGLVARDSAQFAHRLTPALESGKAQVIFAIGGPYGFDESVRTRAAQAWSLSPLTLNHWIAQLTALEQLYRAFTILKNIPYHND